MIKHLKIALSIFFCVTNILLQAATPQTANQTDTLTPICTKPFKPFQVRIEQAGFSLPKGIQSYAWAVHKDKWLFLAGRTNGLHGFDPGNNNFPPSEQNYIVYVVHPATGQVFSRSLYDPSSGLTQAQIDTLTVTSPQSEWKGDTLYITGGYGVDTATGLFSTKPTLTAINIPGLISWVENPSLGGSAAECIRQVHHPIFQVTGGDMYQMENDLFLLVFGQNFTGFYTPGSDGLYTKQIRRFKIHDDGCCLGFKPLEPKPEGDIPSYRRRDLNVVPAIFEEGGHFKPGLIALSGVFTLDVGVWTVPVEISRHGKPHMDNPRHPFTFKQGMNNYQSASVGLFSKHHKELHTVLFGGISFGYFQNGVFTTDPLIPFINQVTTVTRDKCGHYTQNLMEGTFPVIYSTLSNPGNPLLFGAGSRFLFAHDVPRYSNDVIDLDALREGEHLVGYIVGGIQSTLPDTNFPSDSAASPYIFRVIVIR